MGTATLHDPHCGVGGWTCRHPIAALAVRLVVLLVVLAVGVVMVLHSY
ncbi:hypothetical protein [Mycolicibacterium fortuitum]|nr:hypothetical protein [Mycolicibacterium fortuitum]